METLDLLPELGFVKLPGPSDRIAYELQLGRLKLSAVRSINRYFREVVIFSGYYATQRTAAEVYFELPVEVRSVNHLKAFLSYYLRHDTVGARPEIPKPFWFDEGTSLSHLLPWEIELAEYEGRPHCYVRKDWMKLVLNDLDAFLKLATDNTLVEFRFDNSILEVILGAERIVVTAEGKPWGATYVIPASRITNLPRRLSSGSVEVGIHDNRLRLGKYVFGGVYEKPTIDADQGSLFDQA